MNTSSQEAHTQTGLHQHIYLSQCYVQWMQKKENHFAYTMSTRSIEYYPETHIYDGNCGDDDDVNGIYNCRAPLRRAAAPILALGSICRFFFYLYYYHVDRKRLTVIRLFVAFALFVSLFRRLYIVEISLSFFEYFKYTANGVRGNTNSEMNRKTDETKKINFIYMKCW